MGIEIVHYPKTIRIEKYSVVYEWIFEPDAGFDFPCDKDGNIYFAQFTEEQEQDYEECEFGDNSLFIECKGIEDNSTTETLPAIARCYCGSLLPLKRNRNECANCLKVFNQLGEEL
jgi:hypothetical protein